MNRSPWLILMTATLLTLLAVSAAPAVSTSDDGTAEVTSPTRGTTAATGETAATSPAPPAGVGGCETPTSAGMALGDLRPDGMAPAARIMPAGSVTPACGNCIPCFGPLSICRIDCRATFGPGTPEAEACIAQCVTDYCFCTAYACPGPPPDHG